jgi:eukaryotic-like serine/threonine-protein kinase
VAARVQSPSWQLREGPRRLTAASDFHDWPATAGRNQIAFASLEANKNLYWTPLDAGRGATAGKLERLTASTASFFNPSLSADGKRLCFALEVPGGIQARVLDLENGKKALWDSPPGVWHFVTISPGGTKVAYAERHEQEPETVVFVADLSLGTTRKVCDFGYLMSWSPDESGILACRFNDVRRTFIALIDVATGQETVCLEHAGGSVYRPRFSPDGRWIAFNAVPEETRSQIYVAPFRGKERIDPGEWIPITDGSHWDDKACWSPDGDLVYFTSDLDGWWCIYARRLDHRTKRPLPEGPFEVLPMHSARLSARNIGVQNFDFAVAADKLVINLGELTGNLWIADIEEQ